MGRRGQWIIAIGSACAAVACGRQPINVGLDGDDGSTGAAGDEATDSPADSWSPEPTSDPDGGRPTGGGDTLDSGPMTGRDTGVTGTGSCCESHPEPGCDDPGVASCVCELNAACCSFEWNPACAAAAIDACGAVCAGDTGVLDTGFDTGVVDTGPDTGDTGPGDTGDTGGMGNACTEIVTFEMQPAEAILSGDWMLTTSMLGEGEIASVMGNRTAGSVVYEPDIPCDDTWYVWVRFWQQGADDSYFATVDGQPMPAAIFEGDCGNGGGGWDWAALNWRDPDDGPCQYVEDPWAPTFTAGPHALEFSFRESIAIGRVLLTNDPTYVP